MGQAVFGAIADLDAAAIDLFVRSLRRTGFSGELVMFTSRVGPDVHRLLNLFDAKICQFDFPNQHRPVQILRFYLYKHFLDQFPTEYESILLTDVTDVCFQADPFVGQSESQLQVFAEEIGTTIGQCEFNSHWIETRFNVEELQRLSDARIFCSGTTLGRTEGIRQYLELMVKHMGPPIPVRGYDQGVHNYLIHNSLLGEAEFVENGTGAVLTMGRVPEDRIRMNDQGRILGTRDQVIPVLHQFNRLPRVETKLREVHGK